jgi:hypothetical protein
MKANIRLPWKMKSPASRRGFPIYLHQLNGSAGFAGHPDVDHLVAAGLASAVRRPAADHLAAAGQASGSDFDSLLLSSPLWV